MLSRGKEILRRVGDGGPATTGDRTTTLWDFENKTTLVLLPTGVRNTMEYAPGGLRVRLEDSTGTKKLVYDG